jgi:hypothetical protein
VSGVRCLNLRSTLTESDGDESGSTPEDNDDYYVAKLPSNSTFIHVLDFVGASLSFQQVARVVELEREKNAGVRSFVSVVTHQEAAKMTRLMKAVVIQAFSVVLHYSWA